MGKRRILPAEIAIGSVMAWDAYDDQGRLLLRKGLVIESSSQIAGLMERGLFVESYPGRDSTVTIAKEEIAPPSAVSSILEARARLELACTAAPSDDFPYQITCIRALIAEAYRLSPDASIATLLLEREGRYSIRHSMDVAVTCQMVGKAMGVAEPQLSSMVAAALTMNMSIIDMQDELQGQKEPLTKAQRELINRHPENSAAMLHARGVDDELWLESVLTHHEAADGSGYGEGRKGNDIPVAAQLISLADIYCARISSRNYRRGVHPNAALRALFLDQGNKVRKGLASQFIKAIGVFPPGTPVRLENGEIAVVVQRGESASTPQVCSIVGPRGMPLAMPIKRDTSRPTYGVREVVEWTDVGAKPSMHALWGKVAAVY
jgi:HD-GYP domain-containing protein (c-di-GMP phosphodiesterase class II)